MQRLRKAGADGRTNGPMTNWPGVRMSKHYFGLVLRFCFQLATRKAGDIDARYRLLPISIEMRCH